jgi:hypothetical protein
MTNAIALGPLRSPTIGTSERQMMSAKVRSVLSKALQLKAIVQPQIESFLEFLRALQTETW